MIKSGSPLKVFTFKNKDLKKFTEQAKRYGVLYTVLRDKNSNDPMQTMQNKTFTHVPIMRNGCVIGVFDENSIFNYLTDDEIIEVDDDLSFKDIEKYIGIDDREMEVFAFIKHTAFIEDLERIFEKYFRKGQRVGMAFLTADGKATSKLMGIITPWDMIGKE